MGGIFKDKYRIPSARLSEYNYASEGFYFVTICTKDRKHCFGEIKNQIMCLNRLGQQVIEEWEKTPLLRPDMNLQLGEFVVMPNHFHAIIYIGENEFNVEAQCVASPNENMPYFASDNIETRCVVIETPGMASLQRGGQNTFQPQSKNLSSIIRGFKSAVTTFARKNDIAFAWQSRYYDRVIRDYNELMAISHYIIHNPSNWKGDDYYT